MLMIRPSVWRLIISFATAKVSAIRPVTLTANVRSQRATDMLLKASARPIAAQFTRMSTRPNCFTAPSTMRAALSEAVRSAASESIEPGGAAHSACALRRPASSMSTSTTESPRFANVADNSRPSPAAAPVTTAHLGSFISLPSYGFRSITKSRADRGHHGAWCSYRHGAVPRREVAGVEGVRDNQSERRVHSVDRMHVIATQIHERIAAEIEAIGRQ